MKSTANWRDWPLAKKIALRDRLQRMPAPGKTPELAASSLHEFTQQAWQIVEPGQTFVDNWHIRGLCLHLEAVSRGDIRQLLINIPPGAMKSILSCVMWPCWMWINRPDSRWMFGTYSSQLAVRDSLKRRAIIESPWYRMNWGDRVAMASDQNQKLRFENTQKGWMFSTTVDGAGTGEHPDFVVIDDPHSARQAESDVIRQQAIDWWDGTISTRGVSRGVRRVVVMQRLHEKDLSGHLLAQGGWEHICLPMRYEPDRKCRTSIGWEDNRERDGQLLWPGLFNDEKVRELERILNHRSPGQLQQRPSSAQGSMFRVDDFRYFTVEYDESSLVEFLVLDDTSGKRRFKATDCTWFQTCDTAQKIKEENDYTVVGMFALTPDGDLVVYDIKRTKLEVPDQYAFLIAQRMAYGKHVSFQGVEDASSGTGLIQMGAAKGTPFKPLRCNSDKVTRALSVLSTYQVNKVFHRSGAAWLHDFEAELVVFPRGANDDQVDVVSYAGIAAIELASVKQGMYSLDPEDIGKLADYLK